MYLLGLFEWRRHLKSLLSIFARRIFKKKKEENTQILKVNRLDICCAYPLRNAIPDQKTNIGISIFKMVFPLTIRNWCSFRSQWPVYTPITFPSSDLFRWRASLDRFIEWKGMNDLGLLCPGNKLQWRLVLRASHNFRALLT